MSSEIKNIDPDVLGQGGMLPQILRELQHYKDQPRLLLVVAASFMDLMVATLVEAHCRNPGGIKGYSGSVQATVLNEIGVVTDVELTWLHWLRAKRNGAAHEPGFRFSDDDMPDWADEHHKTADRLFSLCVGLLAAFWNARVGLFREKLLLEGTP